MRQLSPSMAPNKIKEVIYGQEKRVITTATTFKSSAIKKRPPTYYRNPGPKTIKNDTFMSLSG